MFHSMLKRVSEYSGTTVYTKHDLMRLATHAKPGSVDLHKALPQGIAMDNELLQALCYMASGPINLEAASYKGVALDEEALRLLMAHRDKQSEAVIDLSGATYVGSSLSNLTIKYVTWPNVTFEGVSMSQVTWENVTVDHITLKDVAMDRVRWRFSDITNATVTGGHVGDGCELESTSIKQATFAETTGTWRLKGMCYFNDLNGPVNASLGGLEDGDEVWQKQLPDRREHLIETVSQLHPESSLRGVLALELVTLLNGAKRQIPAEVKPLIVDCLDPHSRHEPIRTWLQEVGR